MVCLKTMVSLNHCISIYSTIISNEHQKQYLPEKFGILSTLSVFQSCFAEFLVFLNQCSNL